MKLNKFYKLEIMKRFMIESELEIFQADYNNSKVVPVGRKTLDAKEEK